MDLCEQPTVGALLKERRQELELSLAEISSKTHIRRAYLEALEADNFEALPGEAYQSGFLRNYAGALGLESDSLLRQWKRQTGKENDGRTREPSPALSARRVARPSSHPRRRFGFSPLLLGLLLVLTAALYLSVENRTTAAVAVPDPAERSLPRPKETAPKATAAETVSTLPPALPEPAAEIIHKQEKAAPLPTIPEGGSVVRLETLGSLTVEVTVDSRPQQRYVLSPASSLQWNVDRSARLTLDDPSIAKVWLSGKLIDLAGRSDIVLQREEAK